MGSAAEALERVRDGPLPYGEAYMTLTERRQFPRQDIHLKVRFMSGGTPYEGITNDLSMIGASIQSPERPTPGKNTWLEVFPSPTSPGLQVLCTVIRTIEAGERPADEVGGFAVEWVRAVANQHLGSLQQFVKEILSIKKGLIRIKERGPGQKVYAFEFEHDLLLTNHKSAATVKTPRPMKGIVPPTPTPRRLHAPEEVAAPRSIPLEGAKAEGLAIGGANDEPATKQESHHGVPVRRTTRAYPVEDGGVSAPPPAGKPTESSTSSAPSSSRPAPAKSSAPAPPKTAMAKPQVSKPTAPRPAPSKPKAPIAMGGPPADEEKTTMLSAVQDDDKVMPSMVSTDYPILLAAKGVNIKARAKSMGKDRLVAIADGAVDVFSRILVQFMVKESKKLKKVSLKALVKRIRAVDDKHQIQLQLTVDNEPAATKMYHQLLGFLQAKKK